MKVGDLVRWKGCWGKVGTGSPGIVLETKPTKPPYGEEPKTAVLAYIRECPNPEWFHEKELAVINDRW